MKPFEACVLLFCILIIGILCDMRNTLEKIEKNVTVVQVKEEISAPPYATSIIMGKEIL